MPAGIGAVRAFSPFLRKREHLGQDRQGTIGGIGFCSLIVVKPGNVRAGNVPHRLPPDGRQYVNFDQPPVLNRRARLGFCGDVFAQKALRESGDGRRGLFGRSQAAGSAPLATAPDSRAASFRACSGVKADRGDRS